MLVVYYGATDSVGVGVPDWWRILYSDPDGDGQPNSAEYLSGTIPTAGNSAFRITNVARLNSTDTVVTWDSVAGKKYAVQSTDAMTNGFTALSATNTAGTTTMTFTNTTGIPARFYPVQLVP